MSRVIKFRTWDERLKVYWHTIEGATRHGLILTSDGIPGIVTDVFDKFSPEKTINYFESTCLVTEQFTGLLDKNGREIYEGDVVRAQKYEDPTQEKLTGLVLWADYGDGEYVECLETWMLHWVLHEGLSDGFATPLSCAIRSGGVRWSRGFRVWPGTVEVIGNIHDNPELLKP